jgi:chromosome partitioning protein
MNQNALVLADSVLVPVACDYLSLVGVRQVIKTVKNVNSAPPPPRANLGRPPDVLRRPRQDLQRRRRHAEAALRRQVPPSRSARRPASKRPRRQGQTIFELAPESNASEDYRAVVERLVTGKGAELPADFSPASQPMAANA